MLIENKDSLLRFVISAIQYPPVLANYLIVAAWRPISTWLFYERNISTGKLWGLRCDGGFYKPDRILMRYHSVREWRILSFLSIPVQQCHQVEWGRRNHAAGVVAEPGTRRWFVPWEDYSGRRLQLLSWDMEWQVLDRLQSVDRDLRTLDCITANQPKCVHQELRGAKPRNCCTTSSVVIGIVFDLKRGNFMLSLWLIGIASFSYPKMCLTSAAIRLMQWE